MRPAISDEIFKLTKAICHLTHLHGDFENLCFVSVAQRLSVCSQCGRHKQNHPLLGKPPSCIKTQLT